MLAAVETVMVVNMEMVLRLFAVSHSNFLLQMFLCLTARKQAILMTDPRLLVQQMIQLLHLEALTVLAIGILFQLN